MTLIVQIFLSHAKSAEGADYLFINVMAQIHTGGIRDLPLVIFEIKQTSLFSYK